jgi:hypothetical protein
LIQAGKQVYQILLRGKKMKARKYSTHFAKLSNLIISMPEDQQAKLLDWACRVQKSENPFANSGRNNTILFFTYGFLAAWGLVTIILIIFSAT